MPPRSPVDHCNEFLLVAGLVGCQKRSERRSFYVFCGKIWWTAYLCLICADLCRGRMTRGTAAPTRGRTGSFGAAGLTGGWLSQSTMVSTALPRQHLGRPGRFLLSHSSVMYPMCSYKRLYLKVVGRGGHHHPVGCWHYQLSRGRSRHRRT